MPLVDRLNSENARWLRAAQSAPGAFGKLTTDIKDFLRPLIGTRNVEVKEDIIYVERETPLHTYVPCDIRAYKFDLVFEHATVRLDRFRIHIDEYLSARLHLHDDPVGGARLVCRDGHWTIQAPGRPEPEGLLDMALDLALEALIFPPQ